MDWLTAILAFATTMLILSMIVTTLVETVHRTFANRAKGLWSMMGHFYDRVIQPYLGQSEVSTLERDKFLQVMTENKVDADIETTRPKINFRGTYLNHLPVEIFMERLAGTDFAKVFADGQLFPNEESKDKVRKDIAQKFENYGLDASLKFQQWSRVLSLCFSLIIAFVFYVHPYDLLSTYIKNPEIAEKIAIKSDDAIDRLKEIKSDIVAVNKKKLEAANKPDLTKEVNDSLKVLKKKIEAANEDVEALKSAGAPLQWPEEWTKLKTWDELWDKLRSLDTLPEFLWLIVGALLVGLGAPFWAQSVTSLLKVRDVSKSVGDILLPGTNAAAGGAKEQGQLAGTPASSPSVSSAAFDVSMEAKKVAESKKDAEVGESD